MKLNLIYKAVLLVPAFLLVSCNEKDQKENDVIHLEKAISAPVDVNASDCFSQIRYISLETTDSSLIGKGPYVQIIKDRILVSTNQQQCLMFDKKTGKFIKQVGHIGNDPEGYNSVFCWGDEETGMIYFNGWNKDLVCYDQEGNFRGKIKIPFDVQGVSSSSFSYQNDGIFVLHKSGLFGNGESNLLFFKDNMPIDSCSTTASSGEPFDPSDIASISVFKSETGIEVFGPTAYEGTIVIDYKEPETGSIIITANTSLWSRGKDIYFKEVYNDTIYQVKDRALVPAIVLDLGKYHWSFPERFMKNKDNAILITQILDSEDRMIIRFIRELFHKPTLYNAVVTKSTGEVKVSLYADGLKDNLTNFLPMQPMSVSSVGEYVGLISAGDVVEWFEENEEVKDIPQQVKELKRIGEEDNPIVVIMK
nr:DUF4934 domain-containing protein [Parabacteroides goldsteinii]